ncbi:MAG: RHS repeat-associated core domain-containing protein, partial [Pseudomonadota bacterium]
RWVYTWNAGNRLVAMETSQPAINGGVPLQKLEFAYDAFGRRIGKKVSSWDSLTGSYVLEEELGYIYDGWNLLAELSDNGSGWTIDQAHTWGLDLSDTLQGAGGVGGLLMSYDFTNQKHYMPFYNGNGNVANYQSWQAGQAVSDTAAVLEYGPFGEIIRQEGNDLDQLPIRFSTKYQDKRSGHYYYGYRYYDTTTGRWLSRDPIGERGGLNLYGMVGNRPMNYYDYLGREAVSTVTAGTLVAVDGTIVTAAEAKAAVDALSAGASTTTTIGAAGATTVVVLGVAAVGTGYLQYEAYIEPAIEDAFSNPWTKEDQFLLELRRERFQNQLEQRREELAAAEPQPDAEPEPEPQPKPQGSDCGDSDGNEIICKRTGYILSEKLYGPGPGAGYIGYYVCPDGSKGYGPLPGQPTVKELPKFLPKKVLTRLH